MKRLILSAMALALSVAGTAPAGTYRFTNDPTQFNYSIDWCQLGGCKGDGTVSTVPTPSTWVSSSNRITGSVGVFYSAEPLQGWQQDVTWKPGDFNPGMGVLYNNPVLNAAGYSVNDIALTFDQLAYGAGVYVDPYYGGPYTATIALFNNVYNTVYSHTWSGFAGDANGKLVDGTALFIGAQSSNPNIYGAIFQVFDQYGGENFAIGQAGVQATPEPASMLLVGGALLGIGVVLRRKGLEARSSVRPL